MKRIANELENINRIFPKHNTTLVLENKPSLDEIFNIKKILSQHVSMPKPALNPTNNPNKQQFQSRPHQQQYLTSNNTNYDPNKKAKTQDTINILESIYKQDEISTTSKPANLDLVNKKPLSNILNINIESKQTMSFIHYIIQNMIKKYMIKIQDPIQLELLYKSFHVCNKTSQKELNECINYITEQDGNYKVNLPIHLKTCKLPLLHHVLSPQQYLTIKNNNQQGVSFTTTQQDPLTWVFVPVQLPDSGIRFALLTVHLPSKYISYWSPVWNQTPPWTVDMIHKLNQLEEFIFNVTIWNTTCSTDYDLHYIIFTIFSHVQSSGSNNNQLWLIKQNFKQNPKQQGSSTECYNCNWYIEDNEPQEITIFNLSNKHIQEKSRNLTKVSECNNMMIKVITHSEIDQLNLT